jgi:hypothetical protein
MRKLNLQLFSGGHSVTLVADDGFSAASASSTSDVQKNAEVTLTLTLKTGYELADVEVLQGEVTVNLSTKKFTMGEKNVVLAARSKANNLYKVTEDCDVCINGAKTKLTKNIEVVLTKNGGVKDVVCTPTAIDMNDAVQALIDAEILVKI